MGGVGEREGNERPVLTDQVISVQMREASKLMALGGGEGGEEGREGFKIDQKEECITPKGPLLLCLF